MQISARSDKINNSVAKQFLDACRNGKSEIVKSMLEKAIRPSIDWAGNTAMHLACQSNSCETVSVLASHGLLVDVFNKVGQTPLIIASRTGFIEAVEILACDWGADVDLPDMLGMTAIHWAVEKNHESIVELLLKAGADKMLRDKFKRNAVDIALSRNHRKILKTLTTFQPDSKNSDDTALLATFSQSNSRRKRKLQSSDCPPRLNNEEQPSSSTSARVSQPNVTKEGARLFGRRRLLLTSAGHSLLNSLLKTNEPSSSQH